MSKFFNDTMQGLMEAIDIERAEIPKHKKKTKSSTSKSSNKSKHKHEYKDCLFIDSERHPYKGTYCVICGKVGETKMWETEKTDIGYRVLDDEEVFEKYKHLEQLRMIDFWQKYAPLTNDN